MQCFGTGVGVRTIEGVGVPEGVTDADAAAFVMVIAAVVATLEAVAQSEISECNERKRGHKARACYRLKRVSLPSLE